TSRVFVEATTSSMDCDSCEKDLWLLLPGQDNAGDALMIDVDSNATPTCTYVPRSI
ncbi:hypothetical protein Tco_0063222, partial [Tanacetum coccineum]